MEGRKVYVCYDSDRGSKPTSGPGSFAGALIEKGPRFASWNCRRPDGRRSAEHFFVNGGTADGSGVIAAAAAGEARATRPQPKDGKAIILIGVDEHRVNDQAVTAVATDPEMFSRGGFLVRVVDDPAEDLGDVRSGRPADRDDQSGHTPRADDVDGRLNRQAGGKAEENSQPPDRQTGASGPGPQPVEGSES